MHMSRMNKVLFIFGAVIGLALAWYLGSPLFITNRVSEELPGTQVQTMPKALESSPIDTQLPPASSPLPTPLSPETLSEGTFTGFDSLHQASGTARIIRSDGKTYVRLEEDFTVSNGPDLFVYLGKNNAYDADTNLGKLKGNEGSQNYEIPSDINLDSYSEVWVWCRAFSVPFGKAILR